MMILLFYVVRNEKENLNEDITDNTNIISIFTIKTTKNKSYYDNIKLSVLH